MPTAEEKLRRRTWEISGSQTQGSQSQAEAARQAQA